MTFKERLPFFLGGLVIGIIVVIFFFGKKNTSFDYGPNARVLKNIRTKDRVFSEKAITVLNSKKIDTAAISQILKSGNVDMWNKLKKDSCTQYEIKGTKDLQNITLTIKNCDSTAFIEKITIE
ncbi:hypothetical protein ACFQZW_08715 [Lutibacter aestuarii]|uniref:DUF4258 domain-containing protein n=1 Tax=Lutibacter aestuarii TaxID=861111 RepID=A0ABW2Z8X0_9FLAO|nr:hypothetical protein [uncultured Lutibacter sp.]